jgi:hypothetical protein
MKTAILIHGWAGSPNEPLLQWLRLNLEEKGVRVIVPTMPEPKIPKIEPWVNAIAEICNPDEETLFVGHSIGCQTVMRYIQTLPVNAKIAGVVLIAPWMKLDEETIREEGERAIAIARPWEETPIDFKKIREISGTTVAIFSDDDPFIPLAQKELFEKEFNSEIIVEHSKGHFTVNDKIFELPSALNAAEKILKI